MDPAANLQAPLVVLTTPPSPPAELARSELSRYLHLMLDDGGRVAMQRIELAVDPASGLSDEGYAWQLHGATLGIVSGGGLGLLFGVYAFLQEVCGCRFSAPGPDGEFVPRLSSWPDQIAPVRREPLLAYRAVQFDYLEPLALLRQRIDWMVKNGMNYATYLLAPPGSEQRLDIDPQTGEPAVDPGDKPLYMTQAWFETYVLPELRRREIKLDFSHHNLLFWLPPSRYLQEHPDWYALIDGQRGRHLAQLGICLSNADALAAMIEHMRQYLRQNPQLRLLGVVPEDGIGMCQCESCVALDDDPGDAFRGYHGHRSAEARNISKANRYARLLNACAEALAGEFPQVKIAGAAYVDLQWPPRIALHPHVVMSLALYWRDSARPLGEQPNSAVNRFFADLVQQWRQHIGERLGLYEYYMGMNAQLSLPFPMSRVLCAEWPRLRQWGLRGATIQCLAAVQQAYGLNMLAFARCGWQQQVDHDRLLDDYLLGVFGAAGAALRPLFDRLTQAVEALAAHRDDDPEPPLGFKRWTLEPDGQNVCYFVQQLGAAWISQTLSAAQEQAHRARERRQVTRLTCYWQYCLDSARVIQQLASRDAAGAGEGLESMLAQAQGIAASGWIAPRHLARWRRRVQDAVTA